ncbi:MAG: 3-hydroxyacyl-ACP dehydratase FabZ family protein [Chthoniobacteraceae bacterium]
MTTRDPIALGLPHREPFIFIDEVTALDPGESASGRKSFAPETPFFAGHFPGDPLVPGVILTEALAQIAGLAAARPGGGGMRLAAIKAMKFVRAVRPGETINLSARKAGAVGGLWQFSVEARVGQEIAAEGVIVLAETPAI